MSLLAFLFTFYKRCNPVTRIFNSGKTDTSGGIWKLYRKVLHASTSWNWPLIRSSYNLKSKAHGGIKRQPLKNFLKESIQSPMATIAKPEL